MQVHVVSQVLQQTPLQMNLSGVSNRWMPQVTLWCCAVSYQTHVLNRTGLCEQQNYSIPFQSSSLKHSERAVFLQIPLSTASPTQEWKVWRLITGDIAMLRSNCRGKGKRGLSSTQHQPALSQHQEVALLHILYSLCELCRSPRWAFSLAE